jgi:branched-subunit amino acid aminotransferase/4-amino-4-deoxychorismate lyase
MNLELPYTAEEMMAAIGELLKKGGFKESGIRIVLTGGSSKDAFHLEKGSQTFAILVSEFVPLPDSHFEDGVALSTLEHQRELPEIKSLNYITPMRVLPKFEKEGYFDLLYTTSGLVLESSTSNFFIVKDQKLITPRDNILMGTTRRFVIDIARSDFPVEEREVTLEETLTADEAFLTATNKDIVPVVRVDEKKIGTGVPGPATRKLMELFSMATGSR